MARVNARRMAAQIEGDFVVFAIGMRVNRPWKVHRWLPVSMAMRPMLQELEADKESGFLGAMQHISLRSPMLIQYWRSFEDLERYARRRDASHFPAWTRFDKRIGSNGDVGIWHETYKVRAGEYEAIYNNMPPHGLGKAGTLVPAAGRHATAAGRIGSAPAGGDEIPEEPTN